MNPARAHYVLGHSEKEVERLEKQSAFLEPFTRRCLEGAGIGPGMKVLEVGCGAGDVSMLLAERVGPAGQVFAVDRNADVLELAKARARAAGHENVTFVAGDIGALGVDTDFDALVGRLVMLHLKEPAESLAALLRHLVPGALVVFQDFDLTAATSYPPSPLVQLTLQRMVEGFRRGGADPQIGVKLADIFRRAGLPPPQLRCEASLGTTQDWPGFEQLAMVTRTLLPLLETLGLATAAEVDVDTLAQRLREEFATRGCLARGPDIVSAWARKPV